MPEEQLHRYHGPHAEITLSGDNNSDVIEWCEPLPGYFRWSDSNIFKAHKLLYQWGKEALTQEAADRQGGEITSD